MVVKQSYTKRNTNKSARLDRIYINEDSMSTPNIEINGPAHDTADHDLLTLDLRPVKSSKPLHKHPDYLLNSPHYQQSLCDSIKEFLIQHSEFAEQYQQTTISSQHEELINDLRERNLLYRNIDIDGTADLQKKFLDATTSMIKHKMDNFFKQIEGQPEDPEPTKIQKIMDSIIDALERREETLGMQTTVTPDAISIIEALFSDIMQFSNKYKKTHKIEPRCADGPININKT